MGSQATRQACARDGKRVGQASAQVRVAAVWRPGAHEPARRRTGVRAHRRPRKHFGRCRHMRASTRRDRMQEWVASTPRATSAAGTTSFCRSESDRPTGAIERPTCRVARRQLELPAQTRRPPVRCAPRTFCSPSGRSPSWKSSRRMPRSETGPRFFRHRASRIQFSRCRAVRPPHVRAAGPAAAPGLLQLRRPRGGAEKLSSAKAGGEPSAD